MIHICIPLYNRGKHIAHMLASLEAHRKQFPDEPAFCVKISDHHSTDINLDELAKSLPFDVQIFQSDPPFSMCCLNKAIDAVPFTDTFILLDADIIIPVSRWLLRWNQHVVKEQSYYCPYLSTENPDGTTDLAIHDNLGRGNLMMYKSDWQRLVGEIPNFLGNTWMSQHDTCIYLTIRKNDGTFKEIRFAEPDFVAMWHQRPKDDPWFSEGCY